MVDTRLALIFIGCALVIAAWQMVDTAITRKSFSMGLAGLSIILIGADVMTKGMV